MSPVRSSGSLITASAVTTPPQIIVREAVDLVPQNADSRLYPSRYRLRRDLAPEAQRQQIAVSHALYKLNPLARRLINMSADFIIDSGVTVQTEDENLRKLLKFWWENPWNNWEMNLPMRIRDLLIYGEWFHVPVTTAKGQTFINVIQPDVIEDVMVLNASHEVIDKIVVNKAGKDGITNPDDKVSIPAIRPFFNTQTEELSGYVGEAFLFGINRTTDSTRGLGELFTLVDGIDLYEQMLFSRAEKVAQAAAMWWDLTLEGYNQTMIDNYLTNEAKNLPPRSGTVWAHNEKAVLDWKFPQTNADEFSEDVRVQKSHIISSFGFPGTYFDEPGTAGRAVGAEMAEPTFKTIRSQQRQIASFIHVEASYAIWKAQQIGVFPKGDVPDFTVSFPQPNARDIQRTGPAIFRLVQAASESVKGGFMSPESAGAIVATQINRLGLSDMPIKLDELDVDANLKKQIDRQIELKKAMQPFEKQPLAPGQPPPGQKPAATPSTGSRSSSSGSTTSSRS